MAFTPANLALFKVDLLHELLREAQVVIRPQIPSTRLREALSIQLDQAQRGFGALFIPHFFALFVHDGRASVGPKTARFLVYFRNPDDDPRGPTPQRASQQKKLTKDQFQRGLERNRVLEKLNPSGGPFQHMIVVKTPDGLPGRVGPAAGSFFFTRGARAFEEKVPQIVHRKLEEFILRHLPRETIRIPLGF